jgi:hypothetical protein
MPVATSAAAADKSALADRVIDLTERQASLDRATFH